MAAIVESNTFPLAAIKRAMKAAYPEGLVSKEAITEMDVTLASIVSEYTVKAGKIAANSKRKTISKDDIVLAFE